MGRNRNLPRVCVVVLLVGGTAPGRARDQEAPRAVDERLTVHRFAAAPAIVHPIAMDFDSRGRLLVIESHTHFRPEGYQGPKGDRVRILEDTDGDGKADRFGTFFEGTRFTMDIATHPDGAVYLATRNEVLRLRDLDDDGKAEDAQRIVFLDTPGDYPHNGISGLSFDPKGNLVFGTGENLGANYTLKSADGTTLTGGGEGGNIYICTIDGRKLRRIATGFWNPFGTCRDAFGRLFAVDNDPDSMPPCRLLHVVEGGDYGYQFRYGRSGRHIFQAWNGERPGTLPMVGGTGEAPCEVLSYESDGLPREYLGNLLVTTWADHRVDRYVLKERGASVAADPRPFLQGGKDFRPVGLAVAPDGSLFVGDWVLKDYQLHGQGAVWHIQGNVAGRRDRPDGPQRALLSAHRPRREAAARALVATEDGREFLRRQLATDDALVRATCLTALIDAGDEQTDLTAVAERDPEVPIRALAVRGLALRREDTTRWLDEKQPAAVRLAALGDLTDRRHLETLLDDPDPFLRSGAVFQTARSWNLKRPDPIELGNARQRAGMVLAARASGQDWALRLIPKFLDDPDEDVRFLAVKWVADEKLTAYRERLTTALEDRGLNVRMYLAYATALARIDGQDVGDAQLADHFVERLADDQAPAAVRVRALQLVPATHPRLTLALLTKLIAQEDPDLRLEAVRALCEHPGDRRFPILLDTARNPRLGINVQAQALVGLAEHSKELVNDLLPFVKGDEPTLRDEALRILSLNQLTPGLRDSLMRLNPQTADLVMRMRPGKPAARARPPVEKLDAWLTFLEGPAEADAGRRIFFHPKLAGCHRCHRVDGRGRDVGPDLSTIGRTERRRILESVLQPSAAIGPSYQNWRIATTDGKVLSGLLFRTNLDDSTYVDAQGKLFNVATPDVADRQPLPTSIMPAGMADLMTDQELRDLLAYLESRR